MIRVPKEPYILSIDVYLKNGKEYINMDVTDMPFGDDNKVVSFWAEDNVIALFPMSEVRRVDMIFKENK